MTQKKIQELFQTYTNKKIQYQIGLCSHDDLVWAHANYLKAYNHNLPNGVRFNG